MKKLLLLVLLLTSTVVWGEDNDGFYLVVTKISCGQYINERQNTQGGPYHRTKWFVMGYLTAYNRLVPETNSILGNTDVEGVMLWLENYCKTHSLKTISTGLVQLTIELYPNRHKTKKDAGG